MRTAALATLLVDPSLLIVLGYATTFLIYRVLVRKWWKSFGVYAVFLLPVNIIVLWVGGVLPYFNLMPPENVYFGLVPKEWLGNSGNDFMWNGLTLPILGRVLPIEFVPTHHYLLFNIYAFLIWLSYPIILGWASLRGYAHSIVDAPWYKIFFPELLKMCMLAVATFILLSCIALGIARIYT